MFSSPITRRAAASQRQTQSFDLTAALRYMNDKTVKHLNALLPNLGLHRFESHICTLTHDPFPNLFPGVQPRVGIDISVEIACKFFRKFLDMKGVNYHIMRHQDARGLDLQDTIQTIIIYKKELAAKLTSKDFSAFIEAFDAELKSVQPVVADTAVYPDKFDLNKAIEMINDHVKEFWYTLGEDCKDGGDASFTATESGAEYYFKFRNVTALKAFKLFLEFYNVRYQEDSVHLTVLRNDFEKSLKPDHLAKLSSILDKAFDDDLIDYKIQSGAFRLC